MSVDAHELERGALKRKDREQLLTIASALGRKPPARARKDQIIELILELSGGPSSGSGSAGSGSAGSGGSSSSPSEAPAPAAKAETAAAPAPSSPPRAEARAAAEPLPFEPPAATPPASEVRPTASATVHVASFDPFGDVADAPPMRRTRPVEPANGAESTGSGSGTGSAAGEAPSSNGSGTTGAAAPTQPATPTTSPSTASVSAGVDGAARTADTERADTERDADGAGERGDGERQDGQGEREGSSRRRRRRGRDKDRNERGERTDRPERNDRNDRPERQERQERNNDRDRGGQGQGQHGDRFEERDAQGPSSNEPVAIAGYLDLRDEGYGFLRVKGYLPSKEDVYVPAKFVRQFGLRKGDHLAGSSRPAGRGEKNPALLRVDEVNGADPEKARSRPRFEELTPLFPDEKLRLEQTLDPTNMTARIIDLISPIGKGQRGLIVSPPKAGKTTVMKTIAQCIEVNNPEGRLIVLLIDERPEEVTD
ncbi:MAG: hypothetical protein IT196_24395, partial [Acidimicrobiales bacterium]|nr:hypothetical protein [Acidimicrobiales bacterium]